MGKAIRESSIETHVWEKVPNWKCFFVNREKGLCLSVYGGRYQTGWEETKY